MLSILVFSALLPVVLAQYNYPAGSSSAAVVATPIKQASTALQTITVGKGGRLNFDPESLVVASGSKVVFEFYPGHHSVVQGSFDKPCSPSSGLAFYSGTVDSNNGPAVSRLLSQLCHSAYTQITNCLLSYRLRSLLSRSTIRTQFGSTAAHPHIARMEWLV